MLNFLALPDNLPFAAALAIIFLLGVIELFGVIIGAGISTVLDTLLLPDFDISVDADVDGPGPVVNTLSWLGFGQLPSLIVLLIFLLLFAVCGLTLQGLSLQLLSTLLPSWMAALLALPLSLPLLRLSVRGLTRVLPAVDTRVSSEQEFIGRIATIGQGTAKAGLAAQARLLDRHGTEHWVLVEPHNTTDIFPPGTQVILVDHQGAGYSAIHNNNPNLTD